MAAAKPKKKSLPVAGAAAFTDAGTVPGWVTAARVVLIFALASTIPTVLMLPQGNRIVWTVLIASLPIFFVVGGYHLWRRICPLAVAGQLGRLLGRPGTRKVGDWLGERYVYVQFAILFFALSFRLVAMNGTPAFLAGFLIAIVVAAAITSFLFAGKTWCNFLCPVGIVEKMYTEPAHLREDDSSSQCSPCVACKKHCPDIDLEGGYWKEAQDRPRRLVYFAWPGVVAGFYTYYWLVDSWGYYFTGAWTRETDQASKWLDPGFKWEALHFIPRVVAAPLTLAVFGAVSFAVFAIGEKLWLARAMKGLEPEAPAAREARQRVRHRALVLAGFVAFNAFYFFAGQPTLALLPGWVVKGWGALVVLASAAIFFRRWGRREADHVQEKFAQKILKKWEWGDAPPSNDLQDIYLLHTERTKQREARLRAYKETVRELVADGILSRGELVILDSLRAQLGVTDKDHQKVINELSDEERQLFDPSYRGSVEQRLQRQQYRRDLERLVVDAARAGMAPSPVSLEALRGEYAVGEAEQADELAQILAIDGPVMKILVSEVAAIEQLAAAAAAAHDDGTGGAESTSLGFVRFVALGRGASHVTRALGLVGALARRREVDDARARVTARPGTMLVEVGRLRGIVQAPLIDPLAAAVERLASGQPAPRAAAPFLAIAADSSVYLRAAVAILLSRFDDEAARKQLIAALDDPEAIVREAAVRSIASRARLTREMLTKILADDDPRVRHAAVRAVQGGASGEMPAAPDPALLAQTVKGVGNSGMYATLDANASMDTLTVIERMMLLRNVPILAGLEPEDLDELAGVVIERRYVPNEDLFRQGESGDAVFVVVKGRVRVFTGGGALGPERTLSELEAGACIGEMAVLDDAPRSATVRAIERTRCVVIPGAGFKELLATRPQMARSIIGELVRRMRGMMAR
jgi:hypothetical protein